MKGNYHQQNLDYSFPFTYGEIYCYDIADDGTMSFNASIQTQKAFPVEVSGSYNDYGCLVDGDIEIDHASKGTESCRLIIMAQTNWDFGNGHQFLLLDSNLNTVDHWQTPYTIRRYSVSLSQDPETSKRMMVTSGYNDSSQISVSPAPASW